MHVLPAFHLLEGIERLLDILVKLHERILLLLGALGHDGVGVVALNSRGGFLMTETELTNFRRLLRLVENKIATPVRVRVVHSHSLLLTN